MVIAATFALVEVCAYDAAPSDLIAIVLLTPGTKRMSHRGAARSKPV